MVAMRSFGVLGVLIVASGCSFDNAEKLGISVEPPPGNEAPAADQFEKLAKEESKTASDVGVWLVPLWLDVESAQLPKSGDRIRYIDVSAFNLGLLSLPILPLWVTVDQTSVEKSGARSGTGFGWTPFWAWSEPTAGNDVELHGSGIPLLWGSVKIASHTDTVDIRIRHYLWSLGPAFLGLKKGVGDSVVDGYAFYPLLAGGLGGWLWTSSDFQSEFGSATSHGPLNGYLGYYRLEGFSPEEGIDLEASLEMDLDAEGFGELLESDEKSELMKRTNAEGLVEGVELWLGGIVWSAFTDTDTQGAEVNGRHGPLWTMFGYGKEKGESTIILFWYPF